MPTGELESTLSDPESRPLPPTPPTLSVPGTPATPVRPDASGPGPGVPTASVTPPDPSTPPRGAGGATAPRGLRDQVGATKDAAKGLVDAHIELAKAEASEIGGRVARAAALVGCAIALLVMAGLLAVIGTSLFLAEWLFGSMGWGILHGLLLFTAIAVSAVVAAVGVEGGRIGRAIFGGLVVGVLVAIVLGLDAPNRLYTLIGDTVAPALDPASRPLLVGVVVGAIVGLLLGLIVGLARAGGAAAVIGLTLLGALLGAFTAIAFGPQVGIALGIAAGYLAWIVFLGADVAGRGIDAEALKARFMPTQTIETSKETIEWLRRRMPPGIGS